MMLATTALMMFLSRCVDVFWVSLCGRKKMEQDPSKDGHNKDLLCVCVCVYSGCFMLSKKREFSRERIQ